MPLNTKTIKRRIKSIDSTKKITKAMELISAVKMRRAIANVLSSRGYGALAWEMLKEIAEKTDLRHHPLLAKREVKKVGVILITSNRGLAGGFSSRLLQEVDKYIRSQQSVVSATVIMSEAKNLVGQSDERTRSFAPTQDDNHEVTADIILTGKRGKKIYHKFGHTVVAEFDKLDLTTRIEEVLPMAQLVVRDYIEGKYDRIVVAYTDFKSAIQQVPTIKQILPLSEVSDDDLTLRPSPRGEGNSDDPSSSKGEDEGGGLRALYGGEETLDDSDQIGYGFTFEPNPAEVLEVLLPRLIEMQIYQAILESDASEHSSRMLAMRNASDAANDIIKELQQTFNKARQAAITQEIAEIVGGAAALG
ncbi:MAG: F0F1 ATP synthase subunit gamma [Candidatus Magasanikbacteria bacterium]|nr:F0F1 ATP synthase subunit gamma [Candidatus Magasanikbacteria bacterium]